MKGLQFKIALKNVEPAIWRQFQVQEDLSLDELHEVIQVVMGWENAHLYEFRINEQRFGKQDEDAPDELKDADETYIDDLDLDKGDTLLYVYDFGDGWEHELTVEKLLEDTPKDPVCLDGANNCPPEDSGGPWGYAGLMEILADPKHPEYEDMKEWIGGEFDPGFFDEEEINAELKKAV